MCGRRWGCRLPQCDTQARPRAQRGGSKAAAAAAPDSTRGPGSLGSSSLPRDRDSRLKKGSVGPGLRNGRLLLVEEDMGTGPPATASTEQGCKEPRTSRVAFACLRMLMPLLGPAEFWNILLRSHRFLIIKKIKIAITPCLSEVLIRNEPCM